MKEYVNYHKHDCGSNVILADSPVVVDDYIARAKELGHTVLTSVNHGVSFAWARMYLACEKAGIKFVYGVESYIQYEGNNYHIILLAKNKVGMEDLNDLISEASINNFSNRRPYITIEMLKDFINPENIVCTNACSFGILKEPTGELFHFMRKFFGENFYLEVQPHSSQIQIDMNIKAQILAQDYGIKLIGANDSHYIYPEQYAERNDLLAAKRMPYADEAGGDEDNWYMDYPDYDTMFKRFMDQGIWTKEEVEELIDNTMICKDFDNIVICKDLRVPTLYPELTTEQRKRKFAELIQVKWDEYKKNIPVERHEEYEKEIITEMKEWFACHMEDYALTSYEILQDGINNGGIITTTGRGSCASFITNMLLGFSTVDRLKVKVPLLMPRFMTADKVLRGHTTPDIDNNVADITPFVNAGIDRLGEWRTAPLGAFGTLQKKSAFKMVCKARGDISIELQDEMSARIDAYELDCKYAHDEDKDSINLEDYLDREELLDIYYQGEKYFGMITDSKRHASAFCISNINLRREFGLFRTPKKDVVMNLEGKYMDEFGLVKLDWLIVDVVAIIDKVYKEIGIPVPTTAELEEMVKGDQATWDIYAQGLTCCVNQCEKSKTKLKVMRFKPLTVEELAAFIAAIRPAFMTYYERFENRIPFSYNLPELDNLLQGKFLTDSYILYQEQVMLILMWLGFDMKVTYDVMKAISKKDPAVLSKAKDDFIRSCLQLFLEHNFEPALANKETNNIWTLVENNAKYSFNAAHAYNMACDSLYIAWAKAHHPAKTMKALIDYYSEKKKIDKVYQLQIEAEQFGLEIVPLRFRQDNRQTTLDGNKIYTALKSVKEINENTASILYEYKDFQGSVVELFSLIRGKDKLDAGKIKALIYIGYFEEFGSMGYLIWLLDNYKLYKQPKLSTVQTIYNDNSEHMEISYDEFLSIVTSNADKVTPKTFFFDSDETKLFTLLSKYVRIEDITPLEKIYQEAHYIGTVRNTSNKPLYVCTVTKYNPDKKSALLNNIVTGKEYWYSLQVDVPVKEKDIVYIPSVTSREWKGRTFMTVNRLINLTSLFKGGK